MRYAIVYFSSASSELHKLEIETILKNSNTWNNDQGITGLLLYSEGNFFEILEGEKAVVLDLFESIKKDPRHENIIQIFGKEIHKEAYDGFKSDFINSNDTYSPEKFQTYLEQIEVLDDATQRAVKNMLKVFVLS